MGEKEVQTIVVGFLFILLLIISTFYDPMELLLWFIDLMMLIINKGSGLDLFLVLFGTIIAIIVYSLAPSDETGSSFKLSLNRYKKGKKALMEIKMKWTRSDAENFPYETASEDRTVKKPLTNICEIKEEINE